eukprot:CAMPEP_0206254330 /NCGR_PEP_ID=MMETSP0047_2-20121206/23635_1 /ASSEMBLY_ACC=CAM_ASM_000192 /TAXON_ID=195065 /ORGANISM="Chroomonas mesostigmatica_cf, Strain CCMP1168" /LENGTH=233 /DNA_ID=CAMNT_0053680613 /DNA_START=52 /DNA_END=749 /DNA_ORIENTATION=-
MSARRPRPPSIRHATEGGQTLDGPVSLWKAKGRSQVQDVGREAWPGEDPESDNRVFRTATSHGFMHGAVACDAGDADYGQNSFAELGLESIPHTPPKLPRRRRGLMPEEKYVNMSPLRRQDERPTDGVDLLGQLQSYLQIESRHTLRPGWLDRTWMEDSNNALASQSPIFGAVRRAPPARGKTGAPSRTFPATPARWRGEGCTRFAGNEDAQEEASSKSSLEGCRSQAKATPG